MSDEGAAAAAPVDAASLKERLTQANQQRHALEKTIADAVALLNATPVGLHGPLVDEEGFPRGDVDLYAVREARHTLATATNDLHDVEDLLYQLLGDLHEATAESAKQQMELDDAIHAQRRREVEALQRKQEQLAAMRQKRPFLVVENVGEGSPASNAGLRVGDAVIVIGSMDAAAFSARQLPGLAKEVSENEGLIVPVWVLRSLGSSNKEHHEVLELPLVPQRWRGEGLIGCKLAPV